MSCRRMLVSLGVATLLVACSAGDPGASPSPSPDDAAAADAIDGEPGDLDDGGADPDGDDGPDGEGTAAADGAPGDAEDEGDGPWVFAAGDDVPVTLTMVPSEDGGRQTAIFRAYRGDVTFAGQAPVTCQLGEPDGGGGIEPGETRDVTLACEEDLEVAADGMDFQFHERSREIATGSLRR